MDLDPVSLRLVLHIAETGTLVESARRLNIVPSAASKRVIALEDKLQAQLLRRTNHGVELTAAGQALETLARRVLGELDSIGPQIRDYSKGIRGRVRVLAGASAITLFLPNDLAAFLADHPQIDVHFEERDSEGILKAVAENVADIGISFATDAAHGLQHLPYRAYELGVLVPSRHPLARRRSTAFSEVLDFPHIGLWSGSAANLYMNRRAAELGRAVNYRMFVDSYSSLVMLVQSGLGIGIVPRDVMKVFSRQLGLAVLKLDEPWAARELQVYFPSERLQAASRLLVEHLRQDRPAVP